MQQKGAIAADGVARAFKYWAGAPCCVRLRRELVEKPALCSTTCALVRTSHATPLTCCKTLTCTAMLGQTLHTSLQCSFQRPALVSLRAQCTRSAPLARSRRGVAMPVTCRGPRGDWDFDDERQFRRRQQGRRRPQIIVTERSLGEYALPAAGLLLAGLLAGEGQWTLQPWSFLARCFNSFLQGTQVKELTGNATERPQCHCTTTPTCVAAGPVLGSLVFGAIGVGVALTAAAATLAVSWTFLPFLVFFLGGGVVFAGAVFAGGHSCRVLWQTGSY